MMRKIERRICDILKDIKNAKGRTLSVRDTIQTANRSISCVPQKAIMYLLWDSRVAEFDGNILLLGVSRGLWKTRTTRSRINAIASSFGVPHIVQTGGKWKWADGVGYTGIRAYQIGMPQLLINGQFEFNIGP